ncbi:MAG: radical SAM protein [Acidimicrobiales bacterium]|jgi:MoaA/NifB/PqqE/SkfB family radical SAM enzyme|nr:radical SAM protein [Acidimicrobiales bacterium]HMS86932.1 radical SAM protein [Acidimicrobiales bacterium]
MRYVVDMEVTNRCNAKCHFCPRDRTPHQGLMPPEVFDQGLAQAILYRDTVLADDDEMMISLCGLGEPLLNRHVFDFVRKARAADLLVAMSSNGSLLDEEKAGQLLDAGLQQILINVGEEGDDYEEIYQLPFERTLENVVRFNEMAAGRCEITMVLVDHRDDADHIAKMRAFWAGHGLTEAISYPVMNRGGSLFVDHMQYEQYPEQQRARDLLAASMGTPLCGAPFGYIFVGYDAQYYLCCSDWEKRAPLGSIFDASFLDVVRSKLDHVVSRQPVCVTCNLDPVNRLTESLRDEDRGLAPAGSSAELVERIAADNQVVWSCLNRAGVEEQVLLPAPGRRLIPVQAG